MVVEILVLGGNERLLDQIGDGRGTHEQAPFAGEFVDQRAFAGINPAYGGRAVLCKLFVIGQVVAVDPHDCANRQTGGKDGQGGKTEHGPKD